jgi:hypothetical protein
MSGESVWGMSGSRCDGEVAGFEKALTEQCRTRCRSRLGSALRMLRGASVGRPSQFEQVSHRGRHRRAGRPPGVGAGRVGGVKSGGAIGSDPRTREGPGLAAASESREPGLRPHPWRRQRSGDRTPRAGLSLRGILDRHDASRASSGTPRRFGGPLLRAGGHGVWVPLPRERPRPCSRRLMSPPDDSRAPSAAPGVGLVSSRRRDAP